MPASRNPNGRHERPLPAARPGRLASAWPLLTLAALVVTGLVLGLLGLIDWRAMLAWARDIHAGWGLATAIVAAQAVLYTLGLPGSALLWVAAVLYPPPVATLILVTGGTAGALGAYRFARRLTRVTVVWAGKHRLYRQLESHGDFLTLCALRIVPGMPHALLNYTAGTLRLPLPSFLVSTALGHAVKSILYSFAISEALGSAGITDLLRVGILAPLIALTLLLLVGRLALRHRWRRRD